MPFLTQHHVSSETEWQKVLAPPPSREASPSKCCLTATCNYSLTIFKKLFGSISDVALAMVESVSTGPLSPLLSPFALGLEGGELQRETVGLIGGKGPTARPGWGLATQSQPLLWWFWATSALWRPSAQCWEARCRAGRIHQRPTLRSRTFRLCPGWWLLCPTLLVEK